MLGKKTTVKTLSIGHFREVSVPGPRGAVAAPLGGVSGEYQQHHCTAHKMVVPLHQTTATVQVLAVALSSPTAPRNPFERRLRMGEKSQGAPGGVSLHQPLPGETKVLFQEEARKNFMNNNQTNKGKLSGNIKRRPRTGH